MSEAPRERIIRLIAEMRNRTVDRGATPAEAAAFAAKVSEWIEKYQIDEAELKRESGIPDPTDIEVVQNKLKTSRRVFNPGMTAVVSGLAQGMCCKVIMLYEESPFLGREAVYGIVGDSLDADLVCQLATTVVPALQIMSKLEGAEHGHDGARLIRWTNQYLMGAGVEISKRIEAERKKRSEERVAGGSTSTALTIITGESLAVIKRKAAEEAFKELYPRTVKKFSKSEYDRAAHERGREAGKSVSLNVGVTGKGEQGRIGR